MQKKMNKLNLKKNNNVHALFELINMSIVIVPSVISVYIDIMLIFYVDTAIADIFAIPEFPLFKVM